MKRTTLRTSAIALGIAVALPATAQEWDLKWGGFMQQHFAFGSNEWEYIRNAVPAVRGPTETREIGNSKSKVTLTAVEHSIDQDAEQNGADVIAGNFTNLFGDPNDNTNNGQVTNTTAKILLTDVDGTGTSDLTDLDDLVAALEAAELAGNLAGEVTAYFYAAEPSTQFVTKAAVNKSIRTSKTSGVAQDSNTEVHFKPSVTLDNGFKFSAVIEFEGDSGGIDRSYMTIENDSVGKFTLGAHPSMGYGMMVSAPGVGLGINEAGGHTRFIDVHSNGGANMGSANEVNANWESMRVSYQSPSLAGLTVGASYAADGQAAGNARHVSGHLKSVKQTNRTYDIIDLGANFTQSLGEATVTLAARYGTGKVHNPTDKTNRNPREVGLGMQVGVGAFTLGGAYADSDRGDLSSDGFSFGMKYDMAGPWTFGIQTYQGEFDKGGKNSAYQIGASRNLGTGVNWDIYAITASSDRNDITIVPAPEGRTSRADDNIDKYGVKGTVFGTAIKLNF